MDMEILQLSEAARIALYGTLDQDCFNFTWEILLEQSEAVLWMFDHSAKKPVTDLRRYRAALMSEPRQRRPVAVGLTNVDRALQRPLSAYENYLQRVKACGGCMMCKPSVLTMNTRESLGRASVSLAPRAGFASSTEICRVHIFLRSHGEAM